MRSEGLTPKGIGDDDTVQQDNLIPKYMYECGGVAKLASIPFHSAKLSCAPRTCKKKDLRVFISRRSPSDVDVRFREIKIIVSSTTF